MALYAFDGTWNREHSDENVARNTNVKRFFDLYQLLAATHSYNPAAAVSPGPRYDVIRNEWRPIRRSDRIHQSMTLPRTAFNNPTVDLIVEPDAALV